MQNIFTFVSPKKLYNIHQDTMICPSLDHAWYEAIIADFDQSKRLALSALSQVIQS